MKLCLCCGTSKKYVRFIERVARMRYKQSQLARKKVNEKMNGEVLKERKKTAGPVVFSSPWLPPRFVLGCECWSVVVVVRSDCKQKKMESVRGIQLSALEQQDGDLV